MGELIAVRTRSLPMSGMEETVSARDLHTTLGVGRDFSTWIKDQLERAMLLENRDYIIFPKKGENPSGLSGRPTVEYHLTLDSAKHIAMISGTEKGYEVREYFIECEKRLKEYQKREQQRTMKRIEDMLREQNLLEDKLEDTGEMYLNAESEAKELKKTLEEAEPKIKYADAVRYSPDGILIGEFSHFLYQNGVDMGQNHIFSWMRVHGYLCKQKGSRWNTPTSSAMKLGLFKIRQSMHKERDGTVRTPRTTLITAKGQQYFFQKLF